MDAISDVKIIPDADLDCFEKILHIDSFSIITSNIISRRVLELVHPTFLAIKVLSVQWASGNNHAKLWRYVGADLVPMGEGLGGSGGEPDGGVRPDEGHVEPEGQPVNSP